MSRNFTCRPDIGSRDYAGPAPLGRWIGFGAAVDLVAASLDLEPWLAQRTLAVRLVEVVPIACAWWSIYEEGQEEPVYIFGTTSKGIGAPKIPDVCLSDALQLFYDGDTVDHANERSGDFRFTAWHGFERKFKVTLIGTMVDEGLLRRSLGLDALPGEPPRAKALTGRPLKWDWEGALAHVAAHANLPDGLPDGHGASARIVELITDYFAGSGDTPAESEVKKRAKLVLDAVERVGRKPLAQRLISHNQPSSAANGSVRQ